MTDFMVIHEKIFIHTYLKLQQKSDDTKLSYFQSQNLHK